MMGTLVANIQTSAKATRSSVQGQLEPNGEIDGTVLGSESNASSLKVTIAQLNLAL